MAVYYKYIYTQILFVEVSGALCYSSAFLASWTLLLTLDWLGLGVMALMLSDSRVTEDNTYSFPGPQALFLNGIFPSGFYACWSQTY